VADDGQVIWEDPPETAGKPPAGIWIKRLTPLIDRPNTWARVVTVANPNLSASQVAALRRGRFRMPAGRFEFASRRLADGTGAIYARYLGPQDDS
jgi:hypothetical protein